MPNAIHLAAYQARRLSEKGTLLLVRPVLPNPPPWADNPVRSEKYYVWQEPAPFRRGIERVCPWREGETVLCKMADWPTQPSAIVRELGTIRVTDIPGADAEAMGLDLARHLPAFPSPSLSDEELARLVDIYGKYEIAAWWNKRYAREAGTYDSAPWAWWTMVERMTTQEGEDNDAAT